MRSILSLSVKIMKAFFPLLLLLIPSCHTSPINTARYQDATQQSLSSRNSRTLQTTNSPVHDLKASLQPIPLEDDNVSASSKRRLSGHAAVSEMVARDGMTQKAKSPDKAPETGQASALNVIQPAINAVLSDETNHRASRLIEKLDKVDYLSSPLRGTETRDRQALGIQHPEQGVITTSSLDHDIPQHQQYYSHPKDTSRHGDLKNVHTHDSAAYSDSSRQHSHEAKENEVPNTKLSHTPWDNSRTKNPNILDPTSTETSHVSSQSINHDAQAPSTVSSSRIVTPKPKDVDNKQRNDISALAKQVMKKTAMYGRAMYQHLKSALKALTPKQKSPNPSTSGEKERDGYTEEDVSNLVNDIMKEIQMRTDDRQDHIAMLEKNDRWNPKDNAQRERLAGVRDGPLLYMKTKALVNPETVVDAVMMSTKKMFSSRAQQLSWNETSKLLKEVQARLSEVLTPAK